MTRALISLSLVLALGSGCGLITWVGAPCQKHEQCSGLKDGYCARAEICTRECSESKPCPDATTCSAQGRRSVCLPNCTKDEECLPTFACSGGVCVLKAPLEPPK
ncbi:MAG: hypothetical protein U0228_25830 [Myxococcaceae bacterium]